MTSGRPSEPEGAEVGRDPVPRGRMERTPLAVGVVLFWAVVLGIPLVTPMDGLDALLVAALLVAVPALAFAQRGLLSGEPLERAPLYWGSILTLWLLGSASWLVGTRVRGAAAVGLAPVGFGVGLAWGVGLTLIGLLALWIFRGLARALDRPDPPMLGHLLPRTAPERRLFVLLSVSAGVCEELAYRGYLIGVLAPLTGTTVAVVVTSAGFGLVHVYQGGLGMARAGVIGAAFALGFLQSGSLLPAVVAHAAVDLVAGLVIGERLLSHEPRNGVQPERPSR